MSAYEITTIATNEISRGSLTIEAEIVWTTGAIKHLQRYLSRELIWPRKTDHRKHPFNDLALNGCIQGDPWTQDQDINA